jgi:hypothetical protein
MLHHLHNQVPHITPWSRILLKKVTATHLVKKFDFYGTMMFITMFTRGWSWTLS